MRTAAAAAAVACPTVLTIMPQCTVLLDYALAWKTLASCTLGKAQACCKNKNNFSDDFNNPRCRLGGTELHLMKQAMNCSGRQELLLPKTRFRSAASADVKAEDNRTVATWIQTLTLSHSFASRNQKSSLTCQYFGKTK